MSEAAPDISAADALLDEVAALDMALLRHVNAQALAATDPDVLNGLVRSQQRLARSIRTTLTTKARLAEKRTARPDARDRPLGPFPWESRPVRDEGPHDADVPGERDALQEAVQARIRLEYDPAEADAMEGGLPFLVLDAWREDDYASLEPEERLTRMMARVRQRYGPPSTARPEPEPRPGRLAPPMDLPSWDTS